MHCFGGITVHRSDPLTLELPSLRRNHARRRTALRRATPASLATSTRPVRRMKLYLTSSTSARASARSRTPCLFRPKPLGCQPLQRSTSALGKPTCCSIRHFSHRMHPTQSVPDPSAPVQTDSKYIGFHEGGFLQVAVSEAPRRNSCNCALLRRGALQIQH